MNSPARINEVYLLAKELVANGRICFLHGAAMQPRFKVPDNHLICGALNWANDVLLFIPTDSPWG
ncbi:MAG: hypothetical protein A4S09_11645 [Proteobacteria bacterium SG_bin7]|nr:MAG: hypothetical protein A4S09_11645 [Proteobacteria bacterium SG_bin7]